MKFIKKNIFLSIKYIYITVILNAIICRSIAFATWLNSPVKFYHKVFGLDTRTLIEQGEAFYKGRSAFGLYKFIIGSVFWFNNGNFTPTPVILFQYFLGILTCVMIVYVTLHITGKRVISLLAGVGYAWYAPVIMYESVILKESTFVFVSFLTLCSLIFCIKRRFSNTAVLFFGLSLSLPALIRSSGFTLMIFMMIQFIYLFYRKCKNFDSTESLFNSPDNINKMENLRTFTGYRKILKVTFFVLLGTTSVFFPVCLSNYYNTGKPFVNLCNIRYVFKVAGAVQIRDMNIENDQQKYDKSQRKSEKLSGSFYLKKNRLKNLISYLKAFVTKFGLICKAYEMPNNLNYYFVCSIWNFLYYLPGPLLLLPLAISGLFLTCVRLDFFNRRGILFPYLLNFLLVLCIFIPLSRYRTVLLPIFFIYAASMLHEIFNSLSAIILKKNEKASDFSEKYILRKNPNIKNWSVILLYIVIFYFTIPENIPIRAADYLTLAKLLICENKNNLDLIYQCYMRAIELNPNSRIGILNFSHLLLEHGEYRKAVKILSEYYAKHKKDFSVAINLASALNGLREGEKAEQILLMTSQPKNRTSLVRFYYNLAIALIIQKKYNQAIIILNKAMKICKDPVQKQILMKTIKNCKIPPIYP